ncbi:hypothetical protein PTI98_011832 [Pleurotus ostreatus]|nr:hypothetical protein PTI98_011832 [Pleurotus ostreatus]
MQNPAVDLTVLSELNQQLALAQAANQAARANGAAETAPTASVAPALPAPVAANANDAPAQVAANTNAAPIANTPARYFQCPNCDTLHQLVVAASPAAAPLAVSAMPVAAPCTPAGPSTVNDAGSWYSVTRGRQVGVFRGWNTIVASLVEGVPRWRCKRFTTEQQAQAHFNHALVTNDVHIYNDE